MFFGRWSVPDLLLCACQVFTYAVQCQDDLSHTHTKSVMPNGTVQFRFTFLPDDFIIIIPLFLILFNIPSSHVFAIILNIFDWVLISPWIVVSSFRTSASLQKHIIYIHNPHNFSPLPDTESQTGKKRCVITDL